MASVVSKIFGMKMHFSKGAIFGGNWDYIFRDLSSELFRQVRFLTDKRVPTLNYLLL